MADIAKCEFKQCPRKETCYRYTAQSNQYQTYVEFQNICHEKNNYKYYWEIENKNERK